MKRLIPAIVLLLLSFSIFLPGCTTMKEMFSRSSAPQQNVSPVPRYLDFYKILIPGELQKVDKETYIINERGRLVLSGRVESDSLAKFFISSMASDSWTMLQEYKFHGSTKLFFRNANSVVTILISENPLGTKVEIWMVPLQPL
ncbi:MAG: hypothetical protein JW920_06215 [Deltaproteobacteria bacterium]|nr:hypothetical protein [Deltaproteobacteria bacterium]